MWPAARSVYVGKEWSEMSDERRRRASPSCVLEGDAFRDIALIIIRSEYRMRVAMRQSGQRIASPYLFEPVWIWQSSTTLFDAFPGFRDGRDREMRSLLRTYDMYVGSVNPA